MKCDKCHEEATSGHILPHGIACDTCYEPMKQEWREIVERERQAPLDDGPDEYDIYEFERFALRVAAKLLDDEHRFNQIKKVNPLLCMPNEMADYLKGKIIDAIPEYFSTIEAKGHERLFRDGTYRVIDTVPKSACIDACIAIGIIKRSS